MDSATLGYIRTHSGDTPADIIAALAGDARFQRRIYADDLNGLFGRQPQIELKLQDAVANFPRTDQTLLLIAGINRLLQTARLGGQAGWLATDDAEIAAQVRQFAPAVVDAKVLTQDEVDAILALAGGDLHDLDLTEADVQAQQAAFARADAIADLTARIEHAAHEAKALLGEDPLPTAEQLADRFREDLLGA